MFLMKNNHFFKFIISIFFYLVLLPNVLIVSAVDVEPVQNPIGFTKIGEIIGQVGNIVTPIAVLGFIGSIVYAGFTRMTAAGNPEKEKKSMSIAISAAIGFAIIALAPVIVKLVEKFLKIDEVYTGT